MQDKREISIEYYRADRKWVTHRLRPVSIMFSEFYFYLIAFNTEGTLDKPLYFRVDRIKANYYSYDEDIDGFVAMDSKENYHFDEYYGSSTYWTLGKKSGA